MAKKAQKIRWPVIQNRRWFAVAWLIVTGLFLLIIVLALHVRNSDQIRAALAAQNVILTIQSDDAGRAYDMASPGFRKTVTEFDLRSVYDQIGPYIRQSQIDLVDKHVPANTRDGSRISFVYKASKPKTITYIRIVMEKRKGQWLMYGLQTSNKLLPARVNQ